MLINYVNETNNDTKEEQKLINYFVAKLSPNKL